MVDPADDPLRGTLDPRGPLWTMMNRPRPFSPRVIRLGVQLLFSVYGVMAIARHDPAQLDVTIARLGVTTYAALGWMLASRLSFGGLRAYTLGLATVISVSGGYVAGVLGNTPAQLPLTGLATFVGVAFLQTAVDVFLAVPLLALAHWALLAWMPPIYVNEAAVVVMVGSALVCGAATSMIVTTHAVRLNESLEWWRASTERERQALRVKSEFLSTMSHELRSPLHVILGYADVVADVVPPEAQVPLARIRSSALDLLRLVENTMNASRIESGKVPLHLETFDPARLAEEVAADLATLPEAKRGVPVHWLVPSDLPPVHLDRLKVKEIVQNLASNALKFTALGTVRVEFAVDADRFVIAVRDTGPGISAAAQTRIFEMFERIEERGGGQKPPGVGLGLFIVRSLVAMMDGTIDVESTPDVGTCFTVRLPRQAVPVRRAA